MLEVERLLDETPEPGRDCGDCTACCVVLAQDALRKPMRCACPHIRDNRCGIYSSRPQGCRDYNCLWLRGALPAGVCWRPDHLGVLLDAYRPAGSGEVRVAALEVRRGAFEEAAAQTLIQSISSRRPLELSNRDGEWARLEPEACA